MGRGTGSTRLSWKKEMNTHSSATNSKSRMPGEQRAIIVLHHVPRGTTKDQEQGPVKRLLASWNRWKGKREVQGKVQSQQRLHLLQEALLGRPNSGRPNSELHLQEISPTRTLEARMPKSTASVISEQVHRDDHHDRGAESNEQGP